jgi:hypothetical protein
MAEVRDIYTQPCSSHRPKHTKSTQQIPITPTIPVVGEARYYIAVVIQSLDGLANLVLTPLHPTFDPAECLKRIQHEYKDALRMTKPRWRCIFTKYNIGIAHVQLVSGDK